MKLVLFNRAEWSVVPGLLGDLDQLVERINTVWSKQHHPQTGAHTDVTADSLTADSVEAAALTLTATTQTTVGAAGGASALPATPVGYVPITIDGVEYVVPFYLKA